MSFSEKYSRLFKKVCQLGSFQLGVVGCDGVALLGTDNYWDKVGSVRPLGCHLTRKNDCEKVQIIKEPGNLKYCNGCSNINNCLYSLVLYAPLFSGANNIGNLGVMLQSNVSNSSIFDNLEDWKEYTETIVAALSDFPPLVNVLLIRSMTDEMLNQAFQLNENQGLILVDDDRDILCTNTVAKSFFGSMNDTDLTLPLSLVLGEKNVSKFFSNSFMHNELTCKINGTMKQVKRLESLPISVVMGCSAFIIDDLYSIYGFSPYSDKKGHEPDVLKNIVGISSSIKKVKEMISRIAPSELPVLIEGESGTGKELVAKAIHALSLRNNKRLIAINCSSIPDTLFESELFGYERGAFTGANPGGKKGFLELADGGTLFLDEIGELSLINQAKLLRVLEEKEFYRIGGQTQIKCNVRIIAATNANITDMVAKGTFRKDLYYRINSVGIWIPNLKDRNIDILPLVKHFLFMHNNKSDWYISPEVSRVLRDYSWPGNVRELRNAVNYMITFSKESSLTYSCLPPYIKNTAKTKTVSRSVCDKNSCLKTLDTYGRTTAGKRAAASELGISLATFYRLLKRYDIH